MHKQFGLTLMELVITIAVVAILAVASVPVYTDYIETNRLKAASEAIYSSSTQARSEALKQQAAMLVMVTSGGSWCVGVTTASTCNCGTPGNCNLGTISGSEYPGTSLSLNGIVTNVGFSVGGDRGLVTPSGTLTLTATNGDAISIVINKMGFPRLCSATVSGYQPC